MRLTSIVIAKIVLCLGWVGAASAAEQVDLIINNGVIYDGSGGNPVKGSVAVRDGRVVAVGKLADYQAKQTVDAKGLAVAPGFINTLSWATESLIQDGRAMSDIKQGVTLEIFGEGTSMGPVNATIKQEMLKTQGDIRYDITWTTLGEYLDFLTKKGVSPNIASFIGAATVRQHEIGYANRAPTAEELGRMQELVRQAMREGALGVGSSLIYAPGNYAKTDELIAITKAAGEFGGAYISHMRSEGDRFLEALDELLLIAKEAKVPAQVYHLKAAGQKNWPKMQQAIDKIEAARKSGLKITADMYSYTAGATGLDAAMPTWVQEGGIDDWVARLKKPEIRARVIKEMRDPNADFESLLQAAGSADRVLLIGFKTEKLKPLTGKTLAEVARMRGVSPEDAAIDLVIEDHTRVGTAYFLMSEENVKLGLSQPWVNIDSDAEAAAPEGPFLLSNPHPRTYGTFARFLGHYVRDQKVTTLQDAIRRLTSLPATTFKLTNRGCLKQNCFADIVVFDPATIKDHATFEKPHQYATGVQHVFVNGVQVLRDGEHTGAKPGQVVRGPGYQKGS
ncbi:N-acyl-D-amino-acid deacylase family protein [Steroidobacter agaridevorans]|uniref:N-acyl-D-amino-acid deacylase family protein n=1 Tax=Steroidobacter agaridevorans TaxID=2695856 RepID=UPI001321AA7E|nr:D-aminoacylase [Steroidobacter agaridevorans]GFE86342.1 aminoacylase [Steroidobacter agaridevorans]